MARSWSPAAIACAIDGSKGFFIEPTIFGDVKNDMKIAREEIFGPVLSVLTFDDVDEVIEQANNNPYGLAAAVWTRDVKKAHMVSRRLKAGTVWINTYGLMDASLPFGGYKSSGFGRELGAHAMEHYTELKTVWLNMGNGADGSCKLWALRKSFIAKNRNLQRLDRTVQRLAQRDWRQYAKISTPSTSTRSTARSIRKRLNSVHYKGRRKWENLRQIPTQQMRDALMNMIVYQGDTEFASVEQQRNLLENAPTEWDRRAITRVMIEEMRHGWQMCALLVDHFGYSGKVEAQKMLERRAFENKRLLGAFNVDVDNWMDFFTYTDFVDRDGKFQLQMLKYSAFAPLGRSMSYMLREEAFHMGTGNDGLRRIVEAGVIPAWLIQKYLNKWISSSYDLFGTDHSSSAHWAYVWGVKGRYDEPQER